jgi:hypothetical protein
VLVLKKLVVFFIAAVLGIHAESQAIPTATHGSDLQVGGSYLFGYPDYSPEKAYGFGIFVDYDFMQHYGLTFDYRRADVSQHVDNETSYEFGARYHRSYGRLTPYIRAAAGRGIYQFAPTDHSNPGSEGFSAAQSGASTGYTLYDLAGGVDVKLSSHFSARVEGDYQRWLSGPNLENGLTPVLYTAGIGYHLGGDSSRPYPPEMGCRATPSYIFAGDPIKVESNTINVRKATGLTYSWSTSGGSIGSKVSSSDVQVGTTGLAPGEYLVKGRLLKHQGGREIAFCEAPFTVREFEPPTIACSANPSSAVSGTDIAISTTGGSPQNRPLTYSYAATRGVVHATGPTAVLSTVGTSAGPITVTCNTADDLGHSASSTFSVTIIAPPPPVPPVPEPLCSVSFQRDGARPVRVDNEAKACLDAVALKMNSSADSHLIVVGNYGPSETNFRAAQRAVNVKKYLVNEQNIDPSRIEVRIGSDGSRTLNNILIPPGAFFNDSTTHPFSEKSIRQYGEAYGRR